jgi:ribosomal protein S19
MARSVSKGPFIHAGLVPSLRKVQLPRYKRVQARSCLIVPQLIGKALEIHNGSRYSQSIIIHKSMAKRKIGEFFLTRKKYKHNPRVKKKNRT